MSTPEHIITTPSNLELSERPDVGRFTLDGSPELEASLVSLCERVLAATLDIVRPPGLKALVLGGGYGRGQGGVLKTQNGDAPYNDLEFYVFINGNHFINEMTYQERFRRLGELISREAGLHIEFKIDSLEKLRRRSVSIFSYDLVSAHRIVFAVQPPFNGCERHLDFRQIASTEATRLLLNRCTGLLLAQELLRKPVLTSEESDFVGRNMAKAQLALGDALLAAVGRYHWSCLERVNRLLALEAVEFNRLIPRVLDHHATGVQFKLHPTRTTKPIEELRTECRELAELAMDEWLCIENRRLKRGFTSVCEYSLNRKNKFTGTGLLRNLLLNVRLFGPGAAFDGYSPRYPRERLLNSLPLLLDQTEAVVNDSTRRHLQRQLRTQATDWQGLVAAYKQVWSCYG